MISSVFSKSIIENSFQKHESKIHLLRGVSIVLRCLFECLSFSLKSFPGLHILSVCINYF